MFELRMSRFGMLLPLIPSVWRTPSPAGSLAPFSRIASPVTGELAAKTPGPPFCFTYMPCGANGSSALFESA